MKKLILTLTAIAVLVTAMTGCVSIGYEGGSWQMTIVGKGEIVTETFTVGQVNSLSIELHAQLILLNDGSDEIKIELYENWIEHIRVNETDGEVTIDSDWNLRTGWNGDNIPKIYVSSKHLESLHIKGVVEFSGTDAVNTEEFTLKMSGVATGEIIFDVESLNIDISGVGSLNISGNADTAIINSSGAGDLNAYNLDTKDASVTLSGVGSVKISCSEKLDVNLSGVGDVSYKGNPELTQNKSGVGSVKKVS